jgi:ribosomal protein S18 acetylase RimI-like enzyme
MNFSPLTDDDLAEVLKLWSRTEGVGLNGSDSVPALSTFLKRNPGLSRVVRDGGKIVAAVLCGHDGRRGFLYHLAVLPECRRQGLGKQLVEQCLAALRELGIQKCNALVYRHNAEAQKFWHGMGCQTRDDLEFWQRTTEPTDPLT